MDRFNPPENWMVITTLEAHAAGEPLRLITGGLPEIPGRTVLERRRWFRDHLDEIRTGLMFEPRGHADMYGAVKIPPDTEDGDFGVFFLHNEGYSTMCGHAVIALATMTLDAGLIKRDGDAPVLRMDTPAGRVTATASRRNGKVESVTFRNVPSFAPILDREVDVPGIGRVTFDVAYGGAFYAFCDADRLGIGMTPADAPQLIDWGRRIKRAVAAAEEIRHPFEDDLSFLYGTIFTGRPGDSRNHSRNVCIFAEGEVDRSPTGTGVSARAALFSARGELAPGEWITVESILGTTFDVRVAEKTSFGPYEAVVPEVRGRASITGDARFFFDPDDPLRNGFIIR